jgi:hypothetical protein
MAGIEKLIDDRRTEILHGRTRAFREKLLRGTDTYRAIKNDRLAVATDMAGVCKASRSRIEGHLEILHLQYPCKSKVLEATAGAGRLAR